jgi:hypothetical protein
MYCENNAVTFVLVAKDLLVENNYIVNESIPDFGFTVCQQMMKKVGD